MQRPKKWSKYGRMKQIDIELTENMLPNGKIPAGTAQQKRMNRKTGVYYDSANIAAARRFYTLYINMEKLKNRIDEPFTGPVAVAIAFHYKAHKKSEIGQPRTKRPDLDNSVKLIIDCMMKCRLIKDDSQIFILNVSKSWRSSEKIRIRITMGELNEWPLFEEREKVG